MVDDSLRPKGRHRSANVGLIAIQVPKSSPFADHHFRPPKP